jgi:hypothetical protein
MASTFRFREHFVVAVADLPWPGNPGHAQSWCALNAYATELNKSARPGQERPTWAEHQTLNSQLITEASPADLAGCWFHQQRWDVVCYISVAVVRGETVHDAEVLKQWARDKGCDPQCVELAFELLGAMNPVRWSPGHDDLEDGQHRVCAMKAQGVPKTVVYGYP